MRLTRSSRWYAAVIAIFSMLFMQLAVAAYACPQLNAAPETKVMPSAHAHASSCCEKSDPVQPALCHAHGQVGKQSLDKPEPPPVQPFSAVGLVIPLPSPDALDGRANAPADIASLAHTTAPPLAIRHCCLRI